jgi:hypothetical protein
MLAELALQLREVRGAELADEQRTIEGNEGRAGLCGEWEVGEGG